ncbi:hypothetical protein BB559_002592 [Furculomyces boomerangus]|uniref:MADS-box domain-containing protein n=1 Tax=Furculomyces boomerangus TaxID=61424 RepID=A0A2T9YU16_9FUNG|nr:hypothetical protein BB559_002592 [Furculomyces boomerangus]
MGRKKINISEISNPRQKTVTFTRRKSGLMKKAHELSVLCGVKVALVVFDSKNASHVYSSCETPDALFKRFLSKQFLTNESRKKKEASASDDEGGGTYGFDSNGAFVRRKLAVVNEYEVVTNGPSSENLQVKHTKQYHDPDSANTLIESREQILTWGPRENSIDKPQSVSLPYSTHHSVAESINLSKQADEKFFDSQAGIQSNGFHQNSMSYQNGINGGTIQLAESIVENSMNPMLTGEISIDPSNLYANTMNQSGILNDEYSGQGFNYQIPNGSLATDSTIFYPDGNNGQMEYRLRNSGIFTYDNALSRNDGYSIGQYAGIENNGFIHNQQGIPNLAVNSQGNVNVSISHQQNVIQDLNNEHYAGSQLNHQQVQNQFYNQLQKEQQLFEMIQENKTFENQINSNTELVSDQLLNNSDNINNGMYQTISGSSLNWENVAGRNENLSILRNSGSSIDRLGNDLLEYEMGHSGALVSSAPGSAIGIKNGGSKLEKNRYFSTPDPKFSSTSTNKRVQKLMIERSSSFSKIKPLMLDKTGFEYSASFNGPKSSLGLVNNIFENSGNICAQDINEFVHQSDGSISSEFFENSSGDHMLTMASSSTAAEVSKSNNSSGNGITSGMKRSESVFEVGKNVTNNNSSNESHLERNENSERKDSPVKILSKDILNGNGTNYDESMKIGRRVSEQWFSNIKNTSDSSTNNLDSILLANNDKAITSNSIGNLTEKSLLTKKIKNTTSVDGIDQSGDTEGNIKTPLGLDINQSIGDYTFNTGNQGIQQGEFGLGITGFNIAEYSLGMDIGGNITQEQKMAIDQQQKNARGFGQFGVSNDSFFIEFDGIGKSEGGIPNSFTKNTQNPSTGRSFVGTNKANYF